MRTLKTNILNPKSITSCDYLQDVFICLQHGKIISITSETNGEDYEDFTDCVCLPGLIDTHVHLSQYFIRGSHSPNLLHWLNTYTFAEEYKSRKADYARVVAETFFSDMLSKGTTTSAIYTAPFRTACDVAFKVADELKVRAIIGMTMMDMNSPEYLIQETKDSLRNSFELCDKWHNSSPLLQYALTPRFAPTCTSKLMKGAGDFAKNNDVYIQSHLSENVDEIKWVGELFPDCKSYTDVYLQHNLLGKKTIMGHAIHVTPDERKILIDTDTRIAHCPDSNFFIKSGMFPLETLRDDGLKIGLASDVAGGTTLSILNAMKMCNYRQDNYLVPPEESFYMGTLGGAISLGMEDQIGSIEVGKQADLALFKIHNIKELSKVEVMSRLYYLGTELQTKATFIAGNRVY